MSYEWKITFDFKVRLEEKSCPQCGFQFSTIRELIAHLVDKHPLTKVEQLGAWEIKTYILMPYGKRDRTPRYMHRVFYEGREMELPSFIYYVKTFVEGAHWALNQVLEV